MRGPLLRPRARRLPRGARRRARIARRWRRWARRTRRSCSPTATCCCSRCRATRRTSPRSAPTCAPGSSSLVHVVSTMAGFTPEETWDFFAYGMLLNVTTALDFPLRGLGVIFRHRRAIAWGSLLVVLVAAVFALPVFGELGNENDFDDPSAEAVTARNDGHAGVGDVRDAEHRRARAAGRAGRERRRRASAIARVAAALQATPASPRWSPTRPAATAVSSPRTAARPTCWPRSARASPAPATRIEQRLNGVPYVTLGGGAFAARQVSSQVSADIARAELIAFPILFILTLLVFRSAVSALLPLAVGIATILLSFLAIRIVNQFNGMSIFSLNLINGLGPRPGDRLLAVHGQPVPRGAGGREGPRGGVGGHAEDRRPRGRLQRDHRRGGARRADRLPPAVPVLDGRSAARCAR